MERADPTTEPGKILVWGSQRKPPELHTPADQRCSIRLDGKLQRIASGQANVSALLARTLNALIRQRLIPSCAGKRMPYLETMKRNVGTQHAVARNDLALLATNIEASVNEGVHSFDRYLMQH